jgi:soluble cytochrome b562
MPKNRYLEAARASTEFEMRVDLDILTKCIDDSLKYINDGNITKVAAILQILKEHTRLATD